MFGPGEYVPDPTEGMVAVKDLPAPQRDCIIVTTSKRPALAVASAPRAPPPTSGPCTISAMYPPVAPLPSWWRTRRILARLASSIATSISPTSLPPGAMTRTACLPWRCGWWSKIACPTARPVGPSGAITACLSPVPRSKMGWRLGGKTAPGHIGSAFLAWALETFAGSAAVDARSAGPYGVLSAVDNRQDKRGGGKPRHNFLYTSSELSRLKRWSPPLCGMNEFEKPQLLSGKGELHLAHHRLGAIEHQGFLRIQRDQ